MGGLIDWQTHPVLCNTLEWYCARQAWVGRATWSATVVVVIDGIVVSVVVVVVVIPLVRMFGVYWTCFITTRNNVPIVCCLNADFSHLGSRLLVQESEILRRRDWQLDVAFQSHSVKVWLPIQDINNVNFLNEDFYCLDFLVWCASDVMIGNLTEIR